MKAKSSLYLPPMSRAADHAYAEIRRLILSGELPSDGRLKEEELAALCQVSRTPVREALRRLEAQTLIRRGPSGRGFVPNWSGGDAAEIFMLRAALESLAARLAAQHATPPQIETMRRANSALQAAVNRPGSPDIDAFLEQNAAFHGAIYQAAASDRLARLIGNIIEPVLIHRTALQMNVQNLRQSWVDHEALIEAIDRRDGEWAAAVMTAHIRQAENSYRKTTAGSPIVGDYPLAKPAVDDAHLLANVI